MGIANVVIVLATLATAAALAMGIVSMARGGEYDEQHAGQFMSARVGLQAATLLLLFAALALG
jgi:hypothetical protein